MSDKKDCKCAEEKAELKATINMLEGMLDSVNQKARIDSAINSALFHVVKRYRIYKRDGK